MTMASVRMRVLFLILADLLTVCLMLSLAVWGYRVLGPGHYKFGYEFYLRLWPLPLAFVAVNAFFRLYQGNAFYPAAPVDPIEELRRLVGSALIVHLGTLSALALAFQTTQNYSRAVILISAVLTAAFAQPVRDVVRAALRRWGLGQIPVDVLGEETDVARISGILAEDSYAGFRPQASSGHADIAFVCGGVESLTKENFLDRYRHVELVLPGAQFPFFGARVASLGAVSSLEVVNQRKMDALRAEKQVLDKVMSAAVFLLALPIFLLVSGLVKLTSRGPVFYRHARLGKMGRPLRVWKFRTMYADADVRLKALLDADPECRAEWERRFKLADDPRVTPLGRFLRRTSLDELPQLFNVFAGEMALVGPRPIVEAEVPRYGDAYELFASVRPGITGLWQVSGRSDTDYPSRVALDAQYVLNWSPWMDIWILLRTVSAVLLMRGAR